MYKFFGEPLKIITSKISNQPIFRFDTKGEFITDDPEVIKRALGFFDYIEMKAEAVGEKVKKTFKNPTLTITIGKENNAIENGKMFKCKKCVFETDKQSELMRHYKDAHPKN